MPPPVSVANPTLIFFSLNPLRLKIPEPINRFEVGQWATDEFFSSKILNSFSDKYIQCPNIEFSLTKSNSS